MGEGEQDTAVLKKNVWTCRKVCYCAFFLTNLQKLHYGRVRPEELRKKKGLFEAKRLWDG